MRKYFTLLTLALASFSFAGQAQTTKGNISGSIQDGNQKGLESATISLLHAKDSALVKINAADKNGQYRFEEVVFGQYLISVTAVGHQKTFSNHFEVSAEKSSVALQPLVLKAATKEMAGVTVSASRPMIEQKIDKMVLNVEAAVTNAGATALEVLEKAPGVTVDKDGNISLK